MHFGQSPPKCLCYHYCLSLSSPFLGATTWHMICPASFVLFFIFWSTYVSVGVQNYLRVTWLMGHSMVLELHNPMGQSWWDPDTIVVISEGNPRIKEMYGGISNSLGGGIFGSMPPCKPHRLLLPGWCLKPSLFSSMRGSIPSVPAWAIQASKLPASQLRLSWWL